MAKKEITADELPYFKFKPSMWLSGDIQYCSKEAKGYFMDICAFYWQRKCDMMHTELYKKFDKQDLLAELIKQEVIKIEGGEVAIEFLDEQWEEFFYSHTRAVKSGKDGADKRWKKGKYKVVASPEVQVTPPHQIVKLEPPPAEGAFFYIGMELFKTKVSVYCKNEMERHMTEFMLQMKPIKTEEVLEEMDRNSIGYAFNNHNHVMRTFSSIAKQMKAYSEKGQRHNGNGTPTNTKLSYTIPT